MIDTEYTAAAATTPLELPKTKLSLIQPTGTLAVLFAADVLALLLALTLAGAVRQFYLGQAVAPVVRVILPVLVLTICYFVAAGLYPGVCENPVEELRRCCLATTLAFLSLGASTFLSRDMYQSRFIFLFAWLFSVASVPLFRSLARATFSDRSWWGSPVAILGAGKTGKLILDTLQNSPGLGLRPVAVLDDNPVQYADLHQDLVVGPLAKCLEITNRHKISYAIVCMPTLSRHDLLRLMDRYGHCFSHVMVIPDLIGMASLGLSVREVGGIIGLEVSQRLLNPSAQFVKRTLDLILAIALLPIIAPLILLCVLLIKLESRGPAFFGNERIGYEGRKFRAWKLRTMVINGDEVLHDYLSQNPEEDRYWRSTQKLRRDPRVTRIGRILRKTSVDELPQFWNVLIGEMSVVGPRPVLESQIEMYGSAYVLYKRVRPGITGLWQISGRNDLSFRDRARLDAYTIQNWSVWLDIYIIVRTFSVVLSAKGAY